MHTRDITTQSFAEIVGTQGIVLVDFWASWCAPCRAFAPIYDAVAAKHADVVFGKVDTEAEPGLAGAFKIRAIPTLMAFRDGVLLFQQAGMLPAEALEELITKLQAVDMDQVHKAIAEAEDEDAEAVAPTSR